MTTIDSVDMNTSSKVTTTMTNASTKMTTDKISKAAATFLADFQGAVDTAMKSDRTIDMTKFIKQFKLKTADVVQIQSRLTRVTEELELLILGDDELEAGYSNLSIDKQRKLLTMHYAVMEIPTKNAVKDVGISSESDGDVAAAKSVATKKAVKTVAKKNDVAVTMTCDAIYAPSSKYRVVRVFTGNVVVTGVKVKADLIQEFVLGKKFDNFDFVEGLTREMLDDIVDGARVSKFIPSTIDSKVVDIVYTF